MNAELKHEWDKWLATRPPEVQALAARLPIGTVIDDPKGPLYLLGYYGNEKPGLIVSLVNPQEDYNGALASKVYLCHDCIDDLKTKCRTTMKRKKDIKFPKKKLSTGPRPQIEFIDRKPPPFDLEKTGQYSEHWKKAAAAAKIDPPGGRS